MLSVNRLEHRPISLPDKRKIESECFYCRMVAGA